MARMAGIRQVEYLTFADGTVTAKDDTVAAGDALTLGTRFRPTLASSLMGIRFYQVANSDGRHTIALYDNVGTLVDSNDVVVATGAGWREVAFVTPIALGTVNTMTAAVMMKNQTDHVYYAAQTGYFPSLTTVGRIETPASAGVYMYAATLTYPNLSAANSGYFISPVLRAPI